ncbi:MAG: hypothetical protein M0Q87_15235 [Ottowia sp.]|nr:hypothetical protein [Ottowia sp.]
MSTNTINTTVMEAATQLTTPATQVQAVGLPADLQRHLMEALGGGNGSTPFVVLLPTQPTLAPVETAVDDDVEASKAELVEQEPARVRGPHLKTGWKQPFSTLTGEEQRELAANVYLDPDVYMELARTGGLTVLKYLSSNRATPADVHVEILKQEKIHSQTRHNSENKLHIWERVFVERFGSDSGAFVEAYGQRNYNGLMTYLAQREQTEEVAA